MFIFVKKKQNTNNMLDILSIGMIVWLLWVLNSQIGNIATIGLLLVASSFLRYLSLKVFIPPISI